MKVHGQGWTDWSEHLIHHIENGNVKKLKKDKLTFGGGDVMMEFGSVDKLAHKAEKAEKEKRMS